MTLIPFGSVVVRMSRSPVDGCATAFWLDNNVVNLFNLYHFHSFACGPRRVTRGYRYHVLHSKICRKPL